MPTYTPPLRDMQFVMHEVFKVTDEFKAMPQHAEVDVDTINAVIEEAGKFASEVIFPLNISGDTEGCVLDKATHEVKTPTGFKEAYDKYVEGGWAALSCDLAYSGLGLPFVILAFSSAWALRSLGWLRRNARTIQVIGGVLLIGVGVALLTGWWDQFIVWVQVRFVTDTQLPI